MNNKVKLWWRAATVRALKTVAQMVGSAALLAGVLSLLTSIGGLPEVEVD